MKEKSEARSDNLIVLGKIKVNVAIFNKLNKALWRFLELIYLITDIHSKMMNSFWLFTVLYGLKVIIQFKSYRMKSVTTEHDFDS